jgi:alginate O-acetyltransferase complex protein AlgI
MTFTSLSFVLFFSAVLLVYVVIPPRLRCIWLLSASYFFFALLGFPYLLAVLAAVSLLSYWCGIFIHRATSDSVKFRWLWVGIVALLAQLFWLKYLPFFVGNLNSLLAGLGLSVQLPAPRRLAAIGVSYFVFQGISYLADIYFDLLEPERHAGRFALAMSFFPKLLQGPIERGGNILPQLQILLRPSAGNLAAGAQLFIWGMFKKIVIADRLATFVDPIYGQVQLFTGLPLLLATYLYALQILFDFSGYTDMALGLARFFNIRLTPNFNAPYLAGSIPEFWRRWHMSLSSWILDYVFKPLQLHFRDWRTMGTPVALLLAFLLSGLWHGASWSFIAWGGIHGVYLSLSVLTKKSRKQLVAWLGIGRSKFLSCWQVFVTFNLVCFAWIFFRAGTMSDGLYVAINSVAGVPHSIMSPETWADHFISGTLLETILLMALVGVCEVLGRRRKPEANRCVPLSGLTNAPVWVRGCAYGILFYLIAFNGADTQSFIYMQF